MKKYLVTSLLLTGILSFAQTNTKIGAHLAYGSKVEAIGVGANADFGVMDKLSIAPSFTYFFMESNDVFSINAMEFNADVHYTFLDDNFLVYGLGGLNYAYTSITFKGEGTYGKLGSGGDIGFNIGAGAEFKMNSNLVPFAELKYTLSGFDQLVVGGGIRYSL